MSPFCPVRSKKMRKLCTVVADMVHFRGNVEVVQWCRGDPFPDIGPSVGIDTETELITDTCLAPSLVVLGVFDPANNVCLTSAAFQRKLH